MPTHNNPAKRRAPRALTAPNQILAECAAAWNAAPLEARAAWDEAAALLHDGLEPAQLARHTGYMAYCKLNAVNRGVGNPLMVFPPRFGPSPTLPRITLQASWSTEHGLSLVLTPDAPTALKLELWGARPLTAPRPVYDSTKFKKCGYFDGMNGPVNAAPLYLSRYRVPIAGYKIALRVCGVDAHGQRTAPVLLVSIAATSALEMTGSAGITETPPHKICLRAG